MSKWNKLMLALSAVVIGIAVGIFLVFFNQDDFINEEEAKAIVTERYGGSVESIEEDTDDSFFIVNIDGETGTHKIKINRHDSSVEGIETVAKPTEEDATEEEKESSDTTASNESTEEQEDTSEEKNTDQEETEQEKESEPSEPEKPKEAPQPFSVEEAENVAANEVGGHNVYSTWNGEGQNREYYILQIIDGDDEGALVSINGVTGGVNKVVYLDVDEDDYGNIEQIIYEANAYADMVDGRYIEFDDDYFEDYEEDDDGDDDDYDD